MTKRKIAEISDRDELSELDDEMTQEDKSEEDDKLEQTISWDLPLLSNKRQVVNNQSDADDEMSEDEDFLASIGISKYIELNPYITSQSVEFKQLTIDQDIVIDGAQWLAKMIYVYSGVTISYRNGGSLILIADNGEKMKITGADSKGSYGPFDHDQPIS